MSIQSERAKRTEWYCHDRFGMFIHWGIYSIPAELEWLRSRKRISIEDYQKYFDSFDPINYDPKKWAKLAKEAGMKYAVLTYANMRGVRYVDRIVELCERNLAFI